MNQLLFYSAMTFKGGNTGLKKKYLFNPDEKIILYVGRLNKIVKDQRSFNNNEVLDVYLCKNRIAFQTLRINCNIWFLCKTNLAIFSLTGRVSLSVKAITVHILNDMFMRQVNFLINLKLFKMKKIEKLRLKDLVKDPIEIEKLSEIKGGIKIIPLYGCESDVCSQRVSSAWCATTAEICEKYVCTSGVAG